MSICFVPPADADHVAHGDNDNDKREPRHVLPDERIGVAYEHAMDLIDTHSWSFLPLAQTLIFLVISVCENIPMACHLDG